MNNNLSCSTPSEQRRLVSIAGWFILFHYNHVIFRQILINFLTGLINHLMICATTTGGRISASWADSMTRYKELYCSNCFCQNFIVLYLKACKFRPRALKPGLLYTFFHESWPGVCVSVGRLIFVRAISTNHPRCQLQDWEAGYRFSIHCCCKVCFAPQTLRSASKLRLRACWPHEKNKALNR